MNVSIEILEFPLCVKNMILRIKDITKLNIEYIAGKNIVFNNSNLGLKEPHKIIISNGTDKLVLLCDVVCNIYEVYGYKILPIYHPSPISKKSYKGNVPIFEKLIKL